MPQYSDPSFQDAERAELETVAAALSRSPRLVRLVRYLGDKYFLGEIDQLHEYNIATEVFDRSKVVFDAGEDAIARVEAHRLRKRLKEFYEGEGKGHTVQLVIPSGTYVPVFTHRADPVSPSASEQPSAMPENPVDPLPPPETALPGSSGKGGIRTFLHPLKHPGWRYSLLAVTILFAALGIYRISRSAAFAHGAGAELSPAQPQETPQALSPSQGQQPIRIIAGYTGHPQMDSAGALWQADQYFHNGGTWPRGANPIARTSDPLLFEHWRHGDFFYDIPLQPGVYELHLYFVTMNGTSDAYGTFSVSVNYKFVLSGFDINSDALGEDIADERVIRDVSPDKDGYLHLGFTSERGAPALNALAVLPGIPHKQIPIRIITQPTPITDHNGQFWHPDNYFMNGRLSTQRQQMADSPDPDLFAGERYGHFSYAIPVDTRGRYTLVLHFAEFYFGPHASGVGGTGSRVFRVMCNGVMLLDNFDVYKEAGSLHALTKTFYHLKPSAQGKLNLTFEPIENNATISGIEVLDESE
jgi:hypothetical protein